MLFNNTNMRTAMAYTNAVGDKVYPIIVDIKKGIKSTEEVSFVSSDINTGVLSVAFIQGNDTYNVEGAEVICSIMRPDTTTLEIPCNTVNGNTIEVPLGVNGTSQDGVYSFDFKVFKGGNKIVGTPIMNYSVSLSISNDLVVEEDDRLPVLTMLITQVNELKEETRETINQANVATEASREATANAIEATNNANAVSERVSQETATAISEIRQDTANAIASMNQSTSTAISTMNQNTANAIANVNATSDTMVENVNNAISSMDTTVNSKISEMTDVVNNKISEVDIAKNEMINDVSSTKANMVNEVTNAKNEMTTTVTNKVNEVEGRFNALTASQQQSSEVIDARDGETSLKARLDRDIEKAKQVYVNVEGSNISTDSSSGYLKDVEILGNTIQNASNLADIRSVGDKVEGQELYEIPVLSRGKNLWNGVLIDGDIKNDSGLARPDSGHAIPADYVECPSNTNIVISYTEVVTSAWFVVYEYDKDKNYLGNVENRKFTTKPNTRYIKFKIQNSPNIAIKDLMIEVGTVATSYEPYVEDKLTILSPVQLEKVGGVADRIIEKDGVWGVEKNVHTELINGQYNFQKGNIASNTAIYQRQFTNLRAVNNNSVCIISDKFLGIKNESWGVDQEAVFLNSGGYVQFRISHASIGENTFAEYTKENNILIKAQLSEPQFIPLPHDQQIKLRTFANKTNISFLTEIEGTIKAQVPKSLGATVNTHTEQIRSLNNELNRVKKLEESTVSTVTTESDFTTVEATSNGYFEDVKLEGKTLVNLCDKVAYKAGSSQSSIVSDADNNCTNVTITSEGSSVLCYEINSQLKPSTTYTAICQVKTDYWHPIEEYKVAISFRNVSGTDFGLSIKTFATADFSSQFVSVITTIQTDANSEVNNLVIGNHGNQGVGKTLSVKNVILLEGDHTQNPPSYFEGLKSVGDTTDEIVVSSVGENLFDKNQTLTNGYVSMRNDYGLGVIVPSDDCRATDFIRVDSNITYTLNNDNAIAETCGFYDATKKCITVVKGNTVTSPSNAKYMRCTIKRSDFEQGFQIVRGTQTTEYTPHQSDKKRLLYYNNETQTWEKPILRQWDSIEKHSDGKYYYHKRSGEVVLNGTHSTSTYGNESDTHITFNTHIPNSNGVANGNLICDKFKRASVLTNNDCVWMLTPNNFYIRLNKSLLTTQDVEGFKQWLQTNNVTVVYQLAQEKVYECTNIDLITYANETNFIIESGAIVPRTTLKVHNNISNVVSLLQKKVSLLESNVKASQEVQDMMILETDMRMLDIELALMEFVPMTLNLGGSNMLRSATYFNFLKNHIINETYEKEYLENVMNKYLATGRINQDEYDELYKMLYPPVYDIELPIEL